MAFKSGIDVKDIGVKLYQFSVAEEIDAYKIMEGVNFYSLQALLFPHMTFFPLAARFAPASTASTISTPG